MRYLLDTSALSDFVKGDTLTLTKIKQCSPADIAVSALTVMEVEYGLRLNPAKAKKLRPVIDEFLIQITIIPFDLEEASSAAEIRTLLKKAGTPIGAYDVLIGATAVAHRSILVTANVKEFERIVGLSTENWRKTC